ncbi:MAG: hypothetical protein R8G34_22045 [Paracoccaceae bacterium]|nr:hypothetical protein [Paracoccaceae bacterium]
MAAVCVGIGTRLGNERTSGHGVFSIPRLKPRRIVASIFDIDAGALAVFASRTLVGY